MTMRELNRKSLTLFLASTKRKISKAATNQNGPQGNGGVLKGGAPDGVDLMLISEQLKLTTLAPQNASMSSDT
jgi:hypothetical protein